MVCLPRRAPAQIAVTVDHIPVFVMDASAFRTYPAGVAVLEKSGICKDDGVWLIGTQSFDDPCEIIDVSGTACPV